MASRKKPPRKPARSCAPKKPAKASAAKLKKAATKKSSRMRTARSAKALSVQIVRRSKAKTVAQAVLAPAVVTAPIVPPASATPQPAAPPPAAPQPFFGDSPRNSDAQRYSHSKKDGPKFVRRDRDEDGERFGRSAPEQYRSDQIIFHRPPSYNQSKLVESGATFLPEWVTDRFRFQQDAAKGVGFRRRMRIRRQRDDGEFASVILFLNDREALAEIKLDCDDNYSQTLCKLVDAEGGRDPSKKPFHIVAADDPVRCSNIEASDDEIRAAETGAALTLSDFAAHEDMYSAIVGNDDLDNLPPSKRALAEYFAEWFSANRAGPRKFADKDGNEYFEGWTQREAFVTPALIVVSPTRYGPKTSLFSLNHLRLSFVLKDAENDRDRSYLIRYEIISRFGRKTHEGFRNTLFDKAKSPLPRDMAACECTFGEPEFAHWRRIFAFLESGAPDPVVKRDHIGWNEGQHLTGNAVICADAIQLFEEIMMFPPDKRPKEYKVPCKRDFASSSSEIEIEYLRTQLMRVAPKSGVVIAGLLGNQVYAMLPRLNDDGTPQPVCHVTNICGPTGHAKSSLVTALQRLQGVYEASKGEPPGLGNGSLLGSFSVANMHAFGVLQCADLKKLHNKKIMERYEAYVETIYDGNAGATKSRDNKQTNFRERSLGASVSTSELSVTDFWVDQGKQSTALRLLELVIPDDALADRELADRLNHKHFIMTIIGVRLLQWMMRKAGKGDAEHFHKYWREEIAAIFARQLKTPAIRALADADGKQGEIAQALGAGLGFFGMFLEEHYGDAARGIIGWMGEQKAALMDHLLARYQKIAATTDPVKLRERQFDLLRTLLQQAGNGGHGIFLAVNDAERARVADFMRSLERDMSFLGYREFRSRDKNHYESNGRAFFGYAIYRENEARLFIPSEELRPGKALYEYLARGLKEVVSGTIPPALLDELCAELALPHEGRGNAEISAGNRRSRGFIIRMADLWPKPELPVIDFSEAFEKRPVRTASEHFADAPMSNVQ